MAEPSRHFEPEGIRGSEPPAEEEVPQDLRLGALDSPSQIMRDARSRLIDGVLLTIAVAGLASLAALLLRATTEGREMREFVPHILTYSCVMITLLLRRRLSFEVRAGVVLSVFLMLGTYALARSGLLGMATYHLFVFSMLATILFGIRVGMGALLTSMALIGVFGLRVHLGQTTFAVDIDAFVTDPTVWVTRLLSIGLFGSIVIVCVGRLYQVLADSIEARGAAASKLQDANRKLTKEVDFRTRTERELRSSRERVRNLSTHLQETIEEERIRISRELHDELGQSLTGMRMQLGWIESRLGADSAGLLETYRSMTALLDQTIASVKRVCAELRPSIMDDLGLSATLEWLAEDFESRTGIRASVNVEPPEIFGDARHSLAIFRITQEALTNVARHARATEVAITLRERKDELALDVRDNGRGIEEGNLQRTRSFGILGIQERVSLLGGSFSIQGLPGQGTSLHVRLPSEAGTEDDANPDR